MSCNLSKSGNFFEPYRMQDGRGFTDYRSSNELDREIVDLVKKSGCDSSDSYEYKQCLIRNANNLFKNFDNSQKKKMGVYKC